MSSSPSYPTSRHSRFFEEGIAQTGSLIMTTPGGTPIPATPRTSACPSPGRQSSLYLCLPNSPSRVGHGPCESAKEAELMTNGPPPAELEAALKSSSACHRLWKKIKPSTRKDSQRRTPYHLTSKFFTCAGSTSTLPSVSPKKDGTQSPTARAAMVEKYVYTDDDGAQYRNVQVWAREEKKGRKFKKIVRMVRDSFDLQDNRLWASSDR